MRKYGKLKVCKLVLIEFDIQCQFEHFEYEMIQALSIKVESPIQFLHSMKSMIRTICTVHAQICINTMYLKSAIALSISIKDWSSLQDHHDQALVMTIGIFALKDINAYFSLLYVQCT